VQTIKAFRKDENGYYCQPSATSGEKFYYEKGKTYTVPREKVELCKFGFHVSAHFDISETLDYYPLDFNNTHYGIVDLNVIDSCCKKSVGDIITIIKFLPQDFSVLINYDKTGKWTYFAACTWKDVNYKKGFERLLEVDKNGVWIYWAGCDWKEFNHKKAFKKLLEVDIKDRYTSAAKINWKEKI